MPAGRSLAPQPSRLTDGWRRDIGYGPSLAKANPRATSDKIPNGKDFVGGSYQISHLASKYESLSHIQPYVVQVLLPDGIKIAGLILEKWGLCRAESG